MSHESIETLNEPLVLVSNQQETVTPFGPLDYNTTYTWQIDKANTSGKTIEGIRTFTTAADDLD